MAWLPPLVQVCVWCTAASDMHPRNFLVILSSGVFLLQDGLRPAKGANTQVSRFNQYMCSAGVAKVQKDDLLALGNSSAAHLIPWLSLQH